MTSTLARRRSKATLEASWFITILEGMSLHLQLLCNLEKFKKWLRMERPCTRSKPLKTAHVKEKDEKMDVNRGVTNLTASEHKAVHNVLQQFDWSKFGTGSPKQSGGVQQQQLALTNGPILVKWERCGTSIDRCKSRA